VALCAVGLQAQEVRRAEPVAQAANSDADLGKFLAGIPLPDSSPLAQVQRQPLYQEHIRALAKLSQRYDKLYFTKMREWSAFQVAPLVPRERPVFYFFSGPDSLSPLAYYPKAPVYLLGGLESVGSIASPQTLPPDQLAASLANLRKSVEVILSFGHFITKDMKAELDVTAFRGVMPLIFTFVSLTGAEVVSASYIGVQADGSVREYGSVAGGGGLPGVKIVFQRSLTAVPQTIYYVQSNVADGENGTKGGLFKWIASFGTGNSYLKAASYLMHEPYFSRVRNFILQNSGSVLQDDSGIPFKFFMNGQWRCYFYGTYSGTLDIFKKYYQPDYQNAFASGSAALPFGTGYKWREGQSNLMFAVKQEAPRALPAQ